MATDITSQSKAKPVREWDLLVAVLPLLAFAPMLLYQVASIWSRDHMRFFPLVLVFLGVLIAIRFRSCSETRHPIRRWVAIGIFAIAVLIYLLSVWKFSPWLAHLASILVFASWALGRLGNCHWAGIAAWTALLTTTLPLPWNWDIDFMHWLQGLAVWGTAKALDALAIPCLQNGSLIETRGLQLVASEICGGLASVYAFAAFAIGMSLLRKNSFIVALLTLLLVPLWTLLGNFLRMFGILAIHEAWGRDLSSGWDFRILELATIAIVLLFIWVSSRLLMRLFEPIPVADAEFGPIFSGFNKLFCWPQPDPYDELEPDDMYEKERIRKLKEAAERQKREYPEFAWRQHPSAVWTVRAVSLLLLIAAVFPLSSLASGGFSNLNFGPPRMSPEQVESLAGEESLPATLEGDWRRADFRAIRRSPRSRRGEYSLVWHYEARERQFLASLDLPFLGWHDPGAELNLQGWKSGRTTIAWEDDWPWAEIELENELGGTAYMFYALFSAQGEPYTVVPPTLGDAEEGADHREAEAFGPQTTTAVTYQFQMFSESGVELTTSDRTALREKFLQLRDVAIKLPQ